MNRGGVWIQPAWLRGYMRWPITRVSQIYHSSSLNDTWISQGMFPSSKRFCCLWRGWILREPLENCCMFIFPCHSTLRQIPSSSVRKPHVYTHFCHSKMTTKQTLGTRGLLQVLWGAEDHGKIVLNTVLENLNCGRVLKVWSWASRRTSLSLNCIT